MTWTQGRRLATMSGNGQSLSFTYNADGIRTSKTVNGVTHYYHLAGTQILSEEWTDANEVQHLIIYHYDANGQPVGMSHRNSTQGANEYESFLFVKNLQGDIIKVLDNEGNLLVSYTYDAWGNPTSTTYSNSGASTAVVYNPFRYRGYFFDSDTELYYISSRYYNSKIGRWISPEPNMYETLFDSGTGLLTYNVYAYCANNPIAFSDHTGEFILTAIIVGVVAGTVIGGAVGGTIAYNSAKSSGMEGSDLFWATASGVGKGALAGGVAGGIAAAAGGVIVAHTASTIAGTAILSTTATMAAKATEISILQARKSISDGDNGWQVANDCLDSIISNGGKIISPVGTKLLSTATFYEVTDIAKHKVIPLTFQGYLNSPGGKVIPYIPVAFNWTLTGYAFFCNDPVKQANDRGYILK